MEKVDELITNQTKDPDSSLINKNDIFQIQPHKMLNHDLRHLELYFFGNSYFYIEKWTFKGMCEVSYRAKRDKKEATCL